jgi:hypothetical protein
MYQLYIGINIELCIDGKPFHMEKQWCLIKLWKAMNDFVCYIPVGCKCHVQEWIYEAEAHFYLGLADHDYWSSSASAKLVVGCKMLVAVSGIVR